MSTSRSALRTVCAFELRRLFRGPAVAVLFIALVLCCGFAAWQGSAWSSAREVVLQTVQKEQTQLFERRRADLAARTAAGETPANVLTFATAVNLRATLPQTPYAAITAGQADAYPMAAALFPAASAHRLFDGYLPALDNPGVEAAGRFDLAFVIVAVLPLLLLAAWHDMWTEEKETGIAGLLTTQPVPLRTLVAGKALARGLLLVPAAAVVCIALACTGGTVVAGLLSTAAVVLLYGLFWLALCTAIGLRVKHTAASALTCGIVWALSVFMLPAAADAALQAWLPAPDKAANLNALRAEAMRVRAQSMARAASAPPQDVNASKPKIPDTLRRRMQDLVTEEATSVPIANQLRAAEDTRRSAMDAARWLLPSVAAQDALERIAGADADRALAFQSQVQQFLAALRQFASGYLAEDRLLTLADYDRGFPQFNFREPAGQQRWSPLLVDAAVLLLFGALGVIAALRSLRAELHPRNRT